MISLHIQKYFYKLFIHSLHIENYFYIHISLNFTSFFSFSYLSELMKDLTMIMEDSDPNYHTESAELIIQIKSMVETGTIPVKVTTKC